MMEDQIVFGGEKKPAKAIREAYETFKPNHRHPRCPVIIAVFTLWPGK